MSENDKSYSRWALVIGGAIVVLILVFGTFWISDSARKDTDQAVHSVSMLYLDELAGRREQVVASNLQSNIDAAQTAVSLMTSEDLSDIAHLQSYQTRMRQLFKLQKFAFVDNQGRIYTATGIQTNIDDYQFDYTSISEPEISVLNLRSSDKSVVIAMPVDIPFADTSFKVCFMEISMQDMLAGVSVQSSENDATFCNIYTADGVALTDTILGGLAEEDNLLEALQNAKYEGGASYQSIADDFASGRRGTATFTYNGIRETLSYVPITGTDWLLTYLVRESVIGEEIEAISDGIVLRGIVQSALAMAALLVMFIVFFRQNKRNAELNLEKETARARREELEQRLQLQDQLLEQERAGKLQNQMITALSSDYWSVYHIDLDTGEGVCYQSHADLDGQGFNVGDHFSYLEAMTKYADKYIDDEHHDEFVAFIQPEAIRKALEDSRVISYRYMVTRHDKTSYEMVRFAGVRRPEDRDDSTVHSVGACFTDVDEETRRSLAQNEALSDALEAAEKANKAKTAFLSSMSHEIRTPMNAIIGLDNIALNDPNTPPQTREYLEKIGGSAEHLLGLINDILDMSRIESGRLVLKNEDFSFSRMLEAINTMFNSQCQDKGLTYHCHINGHIDEAYIGDNMKLRQVLINILGNAVKFTPEGGSVSLNVERVAQFDGKSTIAFTIADTGIGMSKEYLPHLFDTFSQEDSSSTNKYGSSGLGMAITKNIVEMMNGNIQVESEKGVGTTFVVTVTLADSTSSGSMTNQEIDPHSMSVLVIDDDPIALEHAKVVFERIGIAAELAESGERAIEMVRVRHARHNPYNLILVDWQMPELDGVETTRQIREIIGNESAIIILTAYQWDDVLDEALQAGVDSFISKPLFPTTVLEEFGEAMARKGISISQEEHKAELDGRHVLIAEDMAINSEILVLVLEMRGITADIAENGQIALEKFSENEPGHYDAILMDMRMPVMDGLEATQAIRALDRPDAKQIPIIAMTANAFDEDVQRSLQAGLNAHLTKPVEPDVLFETLESMIKD